MKIVFDASIHLGQFCTHSEDIRIASKNAQIALSAKPTEDFIGAISFNENSWVDHTIWQLNRDQQDIFYPFMDQFHSLKNINRIPLINADANLAIEISESLGIDLSCALTCAIAVINKIDTIQSHEPGLLNEAVTKYMKSTHGVSITQPVAEIEAFYPEQGLEEAYQQALQKFKEDKVNVYEMLRSVHSLT